MNDNLLEKKTWVTPTIEEAPVLITKGGRTPSDKEAGAAKIFDEFPTSPS